MTQMNMSIISNILILFLVVIVFELLFITQLLAPETAPAGSPIPVPSARLARPGAGEAHQGPRSCGAGEVTFMG